MGPSVSDADSSCLKTSGIKSQDCHSRTSKSRDAGFFFVFEIPLFTFEIKCLRETSHFPREVVEKSMIVFTHAIKIVIFTWK